VEYARRGISGCDVRGKSRGISDCDVRGKSRGISDCDERGTSVGEYDRRGILEDDGHSS
jgi:hypothetical protein